MKSILNREPWQLALLSGTLIGLSYHPKLYLGFLAWIAFIPLIHIIYHSTPRSAAKYAYYASVAANFIAFHWIGLNNGATLVPVLLSLTGAVLYLGIFWYLLVFIISSSRKTISPLLLFPFGWIALEWVRSLGPLGFPWANLALSQTNYLPIIQMADVFGTYGIAFWIIMINIGLYLVITSNRPKRYIVFTTAIFVFAAGYGYLRINIVDSSAVIKRVKIAVTQPNIDPNSKWDRENRKSVFHLMDSLHVVANAMEPDLVLWPETALPAYLRLSRTTRNKVMTRVKESGIPLLSGTVDKEWISEDESHYYNGTILLNPDESYQMYNKVYLVPFAEYIPLSWKYPILKELNFGQGNFTPGSDYTLFKLDSMLFSNIICYESSIPNVVRKFVQLGATFITIEANDGYLGNSAGPYQHFALAKLRAIENRVPIIRSANTGISGLFDATGRVLKKIPIGHQAVFLAQVDCHNQKSWYTKHGDIFAILCTIMTMIIIGVSAWRKFYDTVLS
ncbi:MAG: apolipoprotein N-acyltransferase [Candidatus Marinimicrobia bacterium]|nr:apolipoprotein N-acyltransferase [Candidatus Neomarinimicrobiota bacterium]